MPDTVQIDRDVLAELVWFARAGDVALSQRRLRNGFRHVPVCSGDHHEAECFSCQVFATAEKAIGEQGTSARP